MTKQPTNYDLAKIVNKLSIDIDNLSKRTDESLFELTKRVDQLNMTLDQFIMMTGNEFNKVHAKLDTHDEKFDNLYSVFDSLKDSVDRNTLEIAALSV